MVTRNEVHTIFNECDQDNDGIVWLSELKQLALNYTSATDNEESLAEDEDVPLDFDEFCLRFANHIGGIQNHPVNDKELQELDVDTGQIITNEDEEHKHLELSVTSSGVSDCSLETETPDQMTDHTPDQISPFTFSPEEGFEGYGEISSDEPEEEEEIDSTPSQFRPISPELSPALSPTLSPTGSLRRKNSPFRLSHRRLKRSSAPVVLDTFQSDSSVEDALRQQIEDLERKVSMLEAEASNHKDITDKLTCEKREVNEKLLHLEEIYRDMEVSSQKAERKNRDTIQELTEKLENLKESSESEQSVLSHQVAKYEQELRHSHEVKDSLTQEVVKLREVWALSQEQEAMWETKYNDMLHTQNTKDDEIEELQEKLERNKNSHLSIVGSLEEQIKEMTEELEEIHSRRRSDTMVGRLQGKVEKIQEENEKLKEMTESILSRDTHSPLAMELDSASMEEISDAYQAMQKDFTHLQSYVDKLLTNIIAEAPHLLCVDHSSI